MFVRVKSVPGAVNCKIAAWGHTAVSDSDDFREISQAEFISREMSESARRQLLGPIDCNSNGAIVRLADKWISQTGIHQRVFFDGSVPELGAIAAEKCLARARVLPNELDLIIGGTNTGPGYPSLADHIKLALGDETSTALCYDLAEACPVGGVSILDAWSKIRAGVAKKALVVCAEKATTLTHVDNWQGSNLFGDAAFAVLLVASDEESFEFFDGNVFPFGGNIGKVIKTETGFFQDGTSVHKFVGREVVKTIVDAVYAAGIDPKDIKHFVPHQPSGKTLDLLSRKLREAWPTFVGQMHENVSFTGNTSGASTGSIISSQIEARVIEPNDLVVVNTFGSGLTVFNYGFRS